MQLDVKRTSEVASPPLADTFVVLLDDDANAREFLTALLAMHGAIVVGAGSERDAIDLVATGVADVLVGGASSDDAHLSLIQRVRARVREYGGAVPALALTTRWSPSARDEAIDAGYQECLAWPFAAGDVVEATRRLAGKR
jgi:CheY-like chemotaxis protein